jgi:DNA polymerase
MPKSNPNAVSTDAAAAAAAERSLLIADLQGWIRHNSAAGAEWYLDEGGPVEAPPDQIPEGKIPAVARTAPIQAAAETVVSAPAAAPVLVPPAPVVSAAPDKDAAFQAACDVFVGETLAVIARQPSAVPVPEQLLAAHGGDQAAAMAALRAEVLPCTACGLSAGRTTTVFGTGSPRAEVVFIGEAPGRDEDLQGEPFVGASGQLLTRILGAIGYAREDVFICNILKCRPPNNRDPLPDEVRHCEPHLKRQLAILRPRVICCLGRVAAQTLLKTDLSLGTLRRGVHFYEGIPVLVTFHPAALLRNPAWKRDTWDDVRRLRALSEALPARGETG